MSQYRSAPVASTEMPKGISYIVTNEAAERFSFYGMKGILVIFMTKYMMDSSGNPDVMNDEQARQWYHTFTSAVYGFPIIGALIADSLFGKYRTIMWLSVVYCFGHFALAIDETRMGLLVGLTLISIGSGGIKPCVSAHVGDQFGKLNSHLLEKVFGWFYFAINFGAFLSTMLTPWLLAKYGPALAFGIPGVLMALATLFFWMGRNVFIHIPPGGMGFIRETFSKEGLGSITKLFLIYAFVAMFWALFDQTGSAWVQQADRMDRYFLGVEWLPSQIQSINPIMIMIFIPLFNGVKVLHWPGIYPLLHKVWPLTPLRKISIGFFLTVPAFLIPAWIESQLDAGVSVNISLQLLAYVIITAAEVFVSITCLEFSYTQAPKKMKSLVMGLFLLSVSLGNIFVSVVNAVIQNDDGSSKLAGADYYLFFAAAMAVTAVLFIPVAMWYKEHTYIQDDEDAEPSAEPTAEPVSEEELIRPVKVTTAVKLLYTAMGIGIIRSILSLNNPPLEAINALELQQQPTPYMALAHAIGIFAYTGMALFFVYMIGKGRNWARIWYLVGVILGAPGMFFLIPAMFPLHPIQAVLDIVVLAMSVTAMVFLFQGSSSAWFKAKKKLKLENARKSAPDVKQLT